MNRTIKEWIETLPNPYREQALKKDNTFHNQEVNSLSVALETAFIWADTEEGGDYWGDLVEELILKEKNLKDKE